MLASNELEGVREMKVAFKYTEVFNISLTTLYQHGGKFQKAAERVHSIMNRIRMGETDALKSIPVTNHGETRINNCVKYDLLDFCRLITIQTNGICSFEFIGTHDACDEWLEKNKGKKITVDRNKNLKPLLISTNISRTDSRIYSDTDFSRGRLFEKIPSRYYDRITEGIRRSVLVKFEQLTSSSSEEEIEALSYETNDEEKMLLFYDVFTLLRKGDIEAAKSRIDHYTNELLSLESLSPEEIEKIIDGEHYIDFEQFEPELIDHYMKTASFQKWMLFMHPEQRKIVEMEYNGPAKLSGVSGSGKTCVVIKRALHLARKYPNEKILILTLNKSLASLIQNLTEYAEVDEIRKNITIRSFWELCQEELKQFEQIDFSKYYNDVTWKNNEHISDIWMEYYNCENNNEDARVLFDIHQSLIARGVYPLEYLYQEFDFVRSAFSDGKRETYLQMERRGRSIPFDSNYRGRILEGLKGWEDKMEFVGITDYLGLATALYKYIDFIKPKYRCILVDEVQDFGNIELEIVRKLVAEQDNDIFLCGDHVQQVYSKYQNLATSGINLTGRYYTIKKNYRNSREILSAAYHILDRNINEKAMEIEGFDIINPEYANFSTPKPLILKADSLDDEFGYCLNYLFNIVTDFKEKSCIALCGYTHKEVKKIGAKLSLPVLDGSIDIDAGKIFLSDLEQTKGFEFDRVCVINCNDPVIPNVYSPEEENYRELFKLYVAMTRAKRELILSYSTKLSKFIGENDDDFQYSSWSTHEKNNHIDGYKLPNAEGFRLFNQELLKLTGEQFLYTKEAVGISKELQDKMLQLIRGKNVSQNRVSIEWPTIQDALTYINRDLPTISRLFGRETIKEFQTFFKKFN